MKSLLSRVVQYFSVHDWALEARLLRWLTLLWLFVGLVVLFSASYPVADAEIGDGARYFKAQLVWIFLGLIMSRWVARHSLRDVMGISGIGLFLCFGMILATHVPGVGVTVNGATRWLPLGPFLLQPSELLKPFLILQGAQLFGRWHRYTPATRGLWLGVFGVCLMAILTQPNLSTTAVCGITLWLIALGAGLPYRQMLFTAGGGVLAAVLSISIKTYQRERIISFLDPWAQATDNGYQLVQSLLAIGSGGLWGTGFGMGQQKLGYLPIQYTDFIFSVYAEEFGFIGSVLLLLFLAVFSTVALLVALRARSAVNRLVALGCMVLLVGQALINIGVASGSLPTTGLPFPLISYGGSSMMSSLVIAGLLIRVARESKEADVVDIPQPLRSHSPSQTTARRSATRSPQSRPASVTAIHERRARRAKSPAAAKVVKVDTRRRSAGPRRSRYKKRPPQEHLRQQP